MILTGPSVIKAFHATLDDSPGVYRMLDENGNILYIGKAKRLKRRVNSYTQPQDNARIARMISKTASMVALTTQTENEALLLEQQLVKEHNPPYNVKLKDGKTYPGVLITTSQDFPRLTRHRGRTSKKDTFFGPFADTKTVEHAIKQVQRLFMLRTCDDIAFSGRTRPCLLHQIKKCTAPCVGKVTPEHYEIQVKNSIDFLNGKRSDISKTLQNDMMTAATEERYEEAAHLRDRLKALAQVKESQSVSLKNIENADVIALAQEGNTACIQVMFIRQGQMRGNSEHHFSNVLDVAPNIMLDAFIPQFYNTLEPPKLLITSTSPTDPQWICDALGEKTNQTIDLIVPQKGEKHKVVLNALRNAQEALARKQASKQAWTQNLASLAQLAGLPAVTRVEVYDNSHIQGAFALGVAVVASADGFLKNHYRKYNFDKDSGVAGNDVGMMKVMLHRRFERMKAEGKTEDWPQLLLIDGGITQLNAATTTLKGLELSIPCIGVAKGVDRNAGKELLYFPDGNVVALPHNSPTLYFIQRLRDEAHRFAITSHRGARGRAQTKGPLDDIQGLGPAKKRALITRFGSQKATLSASLEEIMTVKGISADIAHRIIDSQH
jgi:excinuclease ABC subunit C